MRQGVFVARKTSDIAMLLSSRSKSRSRKGGGLTKSLVGLIDNLLGRSTNRRRQEKSTQKVSAWVCGILVLVAFGGGFMMGGAFGKTGDGNDPLRANGRTASFVGEVDMTPLSREAFIVSGYPDDTLAAGKERAVALTKYLRAKGIEKARPYLWPQGQKGPLYVVAVYFDGDAQASETMALLNGLPADVPDQVFTYQRNAAANQNLQWPSRHQIQ